MDKERPVTRRFVSPKPSDYKPTSELDRKVFEMISAGYLPGADTVTHEGRATWTFESLASIIGCHAEELLELLRSQGIRFKPYRSSKH